ncbi:MAG: hypothetical protein ACK5ZJ_17600 [Acidobacteriota bacterium]|jgi:hypothetical protein
MMNINFCGPLDRVLDLIDDSVASALESKAGILNHAYDQCATHESGMKAGLKIAIEELLDTAAARRNDILRREAKGDV